VLQEKTLFRGLEALSEALGENTYFLGNGMSLADVACGCTLGYLDLRFPRSSGAVPIPTSPGSPRS